MARRSRAPLRRYLIALAIPIVLVASGTLGYRLIEGWGWLDSIYMTVTTLTTVGFGEVHPLSRTARIFTMLLIMGGVFTVFYSATEFIRAVVSGEIQGIFGRQRMELSLIHI